MCRVIMKDASASPVHEIRDWSTLNHVTVFRYNNQTLERTRVYNIYKYLIQTGMIKLDNDGSKAFRTNGMH